VAGATLIDDDQPGPCVVVGSVDTNFIVDRIGRDVEALLGSRHDEVLGTSLLTLISQSDAGPLLRVLASSPTGGALRVHLRYRGRRLVPASLIVAPLLPAPSCAFALVRHSAIDAGAGGGPFPDTFLRVVARAVGLYQAGTNAARVPVAPDVSTLSDRERDVARRLLRGDRVPAIARSMYLAQSTVRNYLSSTFRKLGVHSQQELLDLFRDTDIRR
jgi:DNA-binding CsgD family transcriptional regulator